MITQTEIKAFQENLIDREMAAKRAENRLSVMEIMTEAGITKNQLGKAIEIIHALINSTDCDLHSLFDATSEVLENSHAKNHQIVAAEQLANFFLRL